MKLEFQWAQVLDASKQMNGWCFRLLPFSLSRVIADKWHFIRCHKLQHNPWLTYPPSIDPSAILLPATLTRESILPLDAPFASAFPLSVSEKNVLQLLTTAIRQLWSKHTHSLWSKVGGGTLFSRQTHSRSKNFIQAKACSCDSRQLPSRITEVHRHFK